MTVAVPIIASAALARVQANSTGWYTVIRTPKHAQATRALSPRPTKLIPVTAAIRPSTTIGSGAGVATMPSNVPSHRSDSMISPDTYSDVLQIPITPEPITAYAARSDRRACWVMARNAAVNSGMFTSGNRLPGWRRRNSTWYLADRQHNLIIGSPARGHR